MSRFWKESYCKEKGRILVASTDIEAGEVVLEDNCIVAAPDGVPVCLKCLGSLPLDNVYVSYECAECHWPVCSETCVNSVSEDHLPECEILSKSKITPQTCGSVKLWYSIVPLLRMLILKRDQTKLYWATVGKFESHWDIRQKQTEVVNLIKYIGAFIRKRLQLTWVTDQDVQHVFGVFKTNGVGHVSANSRVCFLYPNVSLMSHSCLSNTEIASSPARSIQFIAKSKISEGEELTWSYSNILSPRNMIQTHLSETWLFQCQCERCCDLTELGLHYSTFQCSCEKYIHNKCDKCGEDTERLKVKEQNLLKTISTAKDESHLLQIFQQLDEDVGVHETHFIRIRLMSRLIDCATRSSNQDILETVIKHGEKFLLVIKTLEGGRGKLTKKYETMNALVKYRYGVKQHERGQITQECLSQLLQNLDQLKIC